MQNDRAGLWGLGFIALAGAAAVVTNVLNSKKQEATSTKVTNTPENEGQQNNRKYNAAAAEQNDAPYQPTNNVTAMTSSSQYSTEKNIAGQKDQSETASQEAESEDEKDIAGFQNQEKEAATSTNKPQEKGGEYQTVTEEIETEIRQHKTNKIKCQQEENAAKTTLLTKAKEYLTDELKKLKKFIEQDLATAISAKSSTNEVAAASEEPSKTAGLIAVNEFDLKDMGTAYINTEKRMIDDIELLVKSEIGYIINEIENIIFAQLMKLKSILLDSLKLILKPHMLDLFAAISTADHTNRYMQIAKAIFKSQPKSNQKAVTEEWEKGDYKISKMLSNKHAPDAIIDLYGTIVVANKKIKEASKDLVKNTIMPSGELAPVLYIHAMEDYAQPAIEHALAQELYDDLGDSASQASQSHVSRSNASSLSTTTNSSKATSLIELDKETLEKTLKEKILEHFNSDIDKLKKLNEEAKANETLERSANEKLEATIKSLDNNSHKI